MYARASQACGALIRHAILLKNSAFELFLLEVLTKFID